MTLGTRKETYGFLLNLPLIGGVSKKKVMQSNKKKPMVQQVYAFFALLIPSIKVSLRAKRGIEEGISEAKKRELRSL